MAMTYDAAEVARLYREGGTTPTKHISETFGISKSAAAKRVSRCRLDGLLPATSRGNATLASHRPVTAIAALHSQAERRWTVCLKCLTSWPCTDRLRATG